MATNALYRDKRRRVWELDFLRGIAVIAMLFDHLMFDFAYLPGLVGNFYEVNNAFINALHRFAIRYWYSTFRLNYSHPIFVMLFLFLVGTSCAFSRDNVRRGSLLALVAMAFTGVTFVIKAAGLMEHGVVFGILDCIALSILCASAVDIATKHDDNLNLFMPLILGIIILALGISNRFWDIESLWDKTFYHEHFADYIIGTRAYGDDWFALFPWVGMVLMGMYWGKAAYATRVSLMPKLDGKWNKPIKFIGRHALIFYLAHQALIMGLVMLLCACLGYEVF